MINSPNIVKLILLFVLSILGQVLVFNNIQAFGFVNPYIYIIFIMTLPIGIGRGWLMFISFATGFIIDIFCNTLGMHAFACTLIGFIRPYLLLALATRDIFKDDDLPILSKFGIEWYIKYMLVMVLCHHLALFFIEQFDGFFFLPTMARIFTNSIATIICILLVQLFLPTSKYGR